MRIYVLTAFLKEGQVMKQVKKEGYGKAFRKAFPYTLPVLTGYLFIGLAFGVMFQEKGYNFLWAIFMSVVVYAGSGQYLAVNFFVPGISFLDVIFMTFMVNVRHIFYGLSLLERFGRAGKKRAYLIFSLTDETYSLLCTTNVPEGVQEDKFLFAIAFLDHLYWILGSAIGAVAGAVIPFNAKGIDFAMTALFIVIFTEQWLAGGKRIPAVIGVASAVTFRILCGGDNFVLPSMICIMLCLVSGRRSIGKNNGREEDAHAA